MKILFDTNIILDVLLDRKPFGTTASQLFAEVEYGKIQGLVSANTLTTIFYLATKVLGKKLAREMLHKILDLFEIAPVNRLVLTDALQLEFSDFEDAVIYQSACHIGADVIVTRDKTGFKKSTLPIYTPVELLKILHL